MAGFGGNTNDDLLTAAVLDILAQNADGVRTFSANTDKNGRNHRDKQRASVSAVHDAFSDSGLSDVYYSGNAGEDELHCKSCGAVCPKTNKYCGFCAAYLGSSSSKREFANVELNNISMVNRASL